MPTGCLFAEIKVLYELRGAAAIVLGEYACDALPSAGSTDSKTRKRMGAVRGEDVRAPSFYTRDPSY